MDATASHAPEPRSWTRDFTASLVVFLVALPLSLGIAAASGATPQSGLIAAAIGGIVVGTLGGAPLQVSGPAAGLTVMVYGYVQQYGLASIGVIIALGGVLQMLGGVARLARGVLAISPAVLHAMLAGIGVLIALGQLAVVLGSGPGSNAIEHCVRIVDALRDLNGSTLAIGAITLAVLVLWPHVVGKKPWLPGSLVAILAGTLASLALPGAIPRVEVQSDLFAALHLPSFGDHHVQDFVLAGLALAIVASAESLLSAVATDQLHTGPRANLDRELFGQGVANLLSGLAGGLPITGVIVRSSANIGAGARTRWSAVLHGVWMLLFVVFCAPVLAHVPMAALAALLVHVGVKLVKVRDLRRAVAFGDGSVYAVTLLGVVFLNLLWGIGIGFGLALVKLLKRVSEIYVQQKETQAGEIELQIHGDLNFLAVPSLITSLRRVPTRRVVRMQFDLDGLDNAAIDAIRAWRIGYENEGGTVHKPDLDFAWRKLTGKSV